jgi:hypothetical protein
LLSLKSFYLSSVEVYLVFCVFLPCVIIDSDFLPFIVFSSFISFLHNFNFPFLFAVFQFSSILQVAIRTVYSYVLMVRTATDVLVSRDLDENAGKEDVEGGGECKPYDGNNNDNDNNNVNDNNDNNDDNVQYNDNDNNDTNGNNINKNSNNNNRSGKSDNNSINNSELYYYNSTNSMDTQRSSSYANYIEFQEYSSLSFSQKIFQKVLELTSVAEKIRKIEREKTLLLIEKLDR